MDDSSDDRPPMVVAAEWTSRITAISLEMVLPGVFGLWIDRKLGTICLFLILGIIVGMTAGMMHLVRLGDSNNRFGPRRKQPPSDGPPGKDSNS